jgi:hypothetical protein
VEICLLSTFFIRAMGFSNLVIGSFLRLAEREALMPVREMSAILGRYSFYLESMVSMLVRESWSSCAVLEPRNAVRLKNLL